MARLCGIKVLRTQKDCCLGLSVFTFVMYAWIQLRLFYESSVRVPRWNRVPRDMSEMRLPTLFYCPVSRHKRNPIKWVSFECSMTFKSQERSCSATLQRYRGWSPDVFSGGAANASGGGDCVEFGTHDVDVMTEWSAAWNEITLRAAFFPERAGEETDLLQEVELGYLEAEWMSGNRDETFDRYYYPLLRVPYYNFGAGLSGVATRLFLAEELSKGSRSADKYWYAYGGTQLQVRKPTRPSTVFWDRETARQGTPTDLDKQPLGVAHVVVTLEDFTEFVYQKEGVFRPFFAAVGEIAGLGAMLMLSFHLVDTARRGSKGVLGRPRHDAPVVADGYDRLSTDDAYDSGARVEHEDAALQGQE